jgi:hypothetical protein
MVRSDIACEQALRRITPSFCSNQCTLGKQKVPPLLKFNNANGAISYFGKTFNQLHCEFSAITNYQLGAI